MVVVKSYIASKQTSDMSYYLLLSIFVILIVRSWPQTTIIRDGKSYDLAVIILVDMCDASCVGKVKYIFRGENNGQPSANFRSN